MNAVNILVDYNIFPPTKRAIHTALMPRDQFTDADGLHDVLIDFEHGCSVEVVAVRLPGG